MLFANNNEKVSNYTLPKAVGLKVERKTTDEAYEHRKISVAEVKKLIVDYKLTKGDIRGKAIKQWMGE